MKNDTILFMTSDCHHSYHQEHDYLNLYETLDCICNLNCS